MNKKTPYFSVPVLSLLILLIGLMNWRLIQNPSKSSKDWVYGQLQFLKQKRNEGEAQNMQSLFPEGLLFYESLYGIAWSEYLTDSVGKESLEEGEVELKKVSESIYSEEAKSTFQQNLSLPYGAFHFGWSTFVLGQKI